MAVAKKEERESPVKRGKPVKNMEKLFRRRPSGGVNKMTRKQVECDQPGKSISNKRKRVMCDDLYDNAKAKYSIMEIAKEVQHNLAPENPSVIKRMVPSHVTGGFWLGLPKKFCIEHLPKHDTMIVLEDESGEEYTTKYLVEKVGLSAGWRGFSIAHKLLEGDVLVFHLVRPNKFKVYIVRLTGSDEVIGALGLLKLVAYRKQVDYKKEIRICEELENKCFEPLSQENPEENIQQNCQMMHRTNFGPKLYQSENDSDELGSEIFDGIRFAESVVEFKEVRSMEDFNIVVNGLIINSELSKHLQTKYYELCSSQKSFLHDHLIDGLNCRLAAGIIAETINIADAIRNSKPAISQEHFATWDKTLKAFEDLGMNVGFLRAQLNQLINLAAKSRRYEQVKLKQVRAEEEMKTLEGKVLEVKQRMNRLDTEIETMEMNADYFEVKFKEVANAQW